MSNWALAGERGAIAQSVAKALKLDATARVTLRADGRDLFDAYWQTRCRDWLIERGEIVFGGDSTHSFWDFNWDRAAKIVLICPADEFCARAIHELMTSSLV